MIQRTDADESRKEIVDTALALEEEHYLMGAGGQIPDLGGGTNTRKVILNSENHAASIDVFYGKEKGTKTHVCGGRFSKVQSLPEGDPTDKEHQKTPQKYKWQRISDGQKVFGEACEGKRHFDCGGFVSYCYHQACPTITYPGPAENLLTASFGWTEVDKDNIRPGDVAYRSGHVGLCINKDQVISALGKKWGVQEERTGKYTKFGYLGCLKETKQETLGGLTEEKEGLLVQPKIEAGKFPKKAEIEAKILSQKSGGQPLPESVCTFFEPRFGCDFSQIRIHADAQAADAAQAVNAQAFSYGNEMVFGAGQYAPETAQGRRLLAHELTHVIQQGKAPAKPGEAQAKMVSGKISSPDNFSDDLVQRKDKTCSATDLNVCSDEDLLTAVCIGEAGSIRDRDGKQGVINVAVNRVSDGSFPNTVKAVVTQAGQFIGLEMGLKRLHDPAFAECRELARNVMNNPADDPTMGALFFDQDCSKPCSQYCTTYLGDGRTRAHYFGRRAESTEQTECNKSKAKREDHCCKFPRTRMTYVTFSQEETEPIVVQRKERGSTHCPASQTIKSGTTELVQRISCQTGGTCPAREPGEVQDSHRTPARVEALGNYQYLVSNFAVDSPRLKAEVRTHPTLVRMIDRLQADSSLQFELVGYSDCLGQEGRNRTLRQEREQRVWNSLPKALRSRGKLRGGAELSECVDSNQTQSGRARNRSVMINIILVFEGDEITGDPCSPQALPSRASSMDQYLGLVRCVERAYPHYSYRQILSLLRQIYYGHETWSRSRTRHWQNVIPCGLSIPDPRGHLGNRLFRALQDSQESIWIPSPQSNREPIDIGHVYTGIEAMLCPIRQVELEVFGPNPVVNMPNEEFATWGGDLGSAAAQKTHDEIDLKMIRGWPHYFGPSGNRANFPELIADIDSYVIRKGLSGAACEATPGTRINAIASPVSKFLQDYYMTATTPLGGERISGFPCFVRALAGQITGNRITNKSALVRPIRVRVESFARIFYLSLVRVPLFAIGPLEGMRLLQYSWEVTDRFLDWLESRL